MPRALDPKDIDFLAVHPAIGVARVGNHPDAHFFGPEAPGVAFVPDGGTKQDKKIKRQAARFRVFATLKNGDVTEVTAAQAEIVWTVEIANLKAGWYQFNNAMDLPQNLVIASSRRNPSVVGPARAGLDIRPCPITISGRNVSGIDHQFRNGTWLGNAVYLGEVRTDGDGRLVFLGGRGYSVPAQRGAKPDTFANNDGWRDDVSDGPVRATVRIGEWTAEALPGYVATAPPSYAPGIVPIVTMYDTLRDMFVRTGQLQKPGKPSFTADIWPIFHRMTQYQWVNHGFFMLLGHGSKLDACDPAVIGKLADPSAQGTDFRKRVFGLFRKPTAAAASPAALPPLYGDTFGEFADIGLVNLSVTPTMYEALGRWADGDFVADWSGLPAHPDLDDIPVKEQPAALDRAALEGILGGPFHPGIELTWTMRWPAMWTAPFRLKVLPPSMPVRQDFGDTLMREACLAADGPVSAAGPGVLTRWLGVPWQTDGASCGSAGDYNPSHFLTVPSFWGARVPNEVLAVEDFDLATTAHVTAAQSLKHLSRRKDWLRDIQGRSYLDEIANMVKEWWEVGVVEPRKGADNLPSTVHVETGRADEFAGDDPTLVLARAVANVESPAPPPSAGMAMAKPASPPRPPRRSFGRGEI